MKRVFEGVPFEKDSPHYISQAFLDKWHVTLSEVENGAHVRITVEDLPESKSPSADKPEEKNCENCVYKPDDHHSTDYMCKDCPKIKPKPTEPQEWEQRFIELFQLGTIGQLVGSPDHMIAFIRAEIERAREEEKQATIKYINKAIGTFPSEEFDTILSAMKLDIEQNKHREAK